MENIYTEIDISISSKKKNAIIFDKIMKWCIYILIALIPLWFLPITQNVLNLDKQVLMVVLLTIALIAWLGKLLTQEEIHWYKGLIVMLVLGFVVIYALSAFFSARFYDSLMGFDTHLSRSLINVIYFFIFLLLIVNLFGEKKEREIEIFKFLFILLASSTIAGIIGLLQALGAFIFPWGFSKAPSFNTIGTVTSLGIFLASLLPLALSLLFYSKKWEGGDGKKMLTVFKVLLSVLIIISLITILLVNFRLLWIITAIGMILISGFWLARRHIFLNQNLGWLAIPLTILALCLIFVLFKPVILPRLNLPLELGLSQKGAWGIVKNVIKDNPVLGTGPETFIYSYSLNKPQDINQTIFWNLRFANAPSEIMSLLSEIGILGILALLIVIGVSLVKFIKTLVVSKENHDNLIGLKIGLFSSWLVLFMSWFLYPQNITLLFVFWLFLASLCVIHSDAKDIKTIHIKGSGKMALAISFGFIVIVIGIIGLLYLEASRYIAEAEYKNGLTLVNNGKLDVGINKIVQATVINPYEDKFYRDLAQLFLAQINSDLNNPDLKQEDKTTKVQTGISNAINSVIRATTLNSNDVANWIIRGLIYRNLIPLVSGTGSWAIDSYEKALTLEPDNPYIYTEIGRTYVNGADLLIDQAQKDQNVKKQMDDDLGYAVEAYNKAIELKSDYAPAQFELALVLDRQGKTDEAINKMEASKTLAPKDSGVAFQLGVLYYKSSQFDKAKTELNRAISLDENFSNARYLLGLLLDKEGNKAGAIEQFEMIAKLNPDNSLVKQILDNLKAGKPALGSEKLGPPIQPETVPIEEDQPEKLGPNQLPQ